MLDEGLQVGGRRREWRRTAFAAWGGGWEMHDGATVHQDRESRRVGDGELSKQGCDLCGRQAGRGNAWVW